MKWTFEAGVGRVEVEMDSLQNGTAYFVSGDFGAEVKDGMFSHPMFGTQYRVSFHPGYTNTTAAILEVLEWRTVDRRLQG